jgi:hypothetical protein
MRSKIGIFLPGQNGDIMSAMSVLKYKDILWPDKDVVWFCSRYTEILKHNDAINEIRHWPEGWGLPERCVLENHRRASGLSKDPLWADLSRLKDANNHLRQDLKHEFEFTKDLEQGYFPSAWMMSLEQRYGIDYPNICRKVFGVDPSWEWHPYLGFLNEEKEAVKEFCLKLPHKKTVMLETDFTSGISHWDDDLTRETMAICRQKLGKCNFIFCSAPDNSRFFDDAGVVSCSQFTIRQTALVNNYADLFIGLSSGLSVATSCWGNKPTPKLQYCGSFIMSTVSLANGPIELVVADPPGSNPPEHERRFPPTLNHRQEFKSRLASMLERLQ